MYRRYWCVQLQAAPCHHHHFFAQLSLICAGLLAGAQKGGMFNKAGEEGIALVLPDTSPRGAGIESEDDDWDFGTGTSIAICSVREARKLTDRLNRACRCRILPQCDRGEVQETLQHVRPRSQRDSSSAQGGESRSGASIKASDVTDQVS